MKNFPYRALCLILTLTVRTCVPLPVPAQTDTQMKAILVFSGASAEEDLDAEEVERYLHYLSHPLEINFAGLSRLISSGLMSRYQAASLEDYRASTGDILSLTELSYVDGFDPEYAALLKPFISFRSRSLPGERPDSTLYRQEIVSKAAVRKDEYNYGLKTKASFKDLAEASFACRKTYSDKGNLPPPSSLSFNVTLNGRRYPWRVMAGDYNLRYGQGLALWSGMSLGGFSSSSSFQKRPAGLSPSYSWSGIGSHRGLAADFQAGRFIFSAFTSCPSLKERGLVNILAGGNIGWAGKDGHASLSAYGIMGEEPGGKVSGDIRWNIRGLVLFGETALDLHSGSLAADAGATMPLGEGWRANCVLRRYPADFSDEYSGGVSSWGRTSDERGAALGIERYGACLTGDYASKEADRSVRQLKVLLKVPVQLSGTSVLTVRLTERFRGYEDYLKYRTGARIDLDWSEKGLSARYGEAEGDTWKGRARVEGLLFRAFSGLGYLEFGRKASHYSAYLRGTMFFVDNWDDRIYSYERDAPGNYNVPAYYGRGYSLSALSGCSTRIGDRKKKTLKAWFRVSYIGYPFMDSSLRKPGRIEAKLQLMASL
ncbi:MAG: hypothetical protein IK076_07830 [Bacteroidales bacterium]|nr:hypothetical protein [Bacteroidales bacterium]